RLVVDEGCLDGDMAVAGAEDIVRAEMEARLEGGEERVERDRLLRPEDAERLEEERALALDPDDRLLPVFAVLAWWDADLRLLRVGDEEVRHRERLGEAVM